MPAPRTDRTGLSVIVHTRNAAATLPAALASVSFADEIVVVDMESDDGTPEIAARAGARVVTIPLHPRVDDVRNAHLGRATHEWTLVLDADERLPDDGEVLVRDLLRVHGDGRAYDAIAIPRFNRIAGRVMRGTGWYPDHQTRLFRKGFVRWPGGVHRPPEVVSGPERLLRLEPPGCLHLHHENYASLEAVIEKQLRYARLETYPDDPDEWDFGEAIRAAYEELARRHDPDNDGDLSVALALVMAWDQLIRGLLHWDRLGRKPPLGPAFCLPIVTHAPPPAPEPSAAAPEPTTAAERSAVELEARLAAAEEELANWKASGWFRLAVWTRARAPRTLRLVKALTGLARR